MSLFHLQLGIDSSHFVFYNMLFHLQLGKTTDNDIKNGEYISNRDGV